MVAIYQIKNKHNNKKYVCLIENYIIRNKLINKRLPSSEIANFLNIGKSTFDRRIKPELEKRKIIQKNNSMSYIIIKLAGK